MDQGVNAVILIGSQCAWRVSDPRQSDPCWAVRGAQHGPGLGWATQTPWLQPAPGNAGARGQLPQGTTGHTACMACEHPSCLAIHVVNSFLVRKCSSDDQKADSLQGQDWCSLVGTSTWALLDAAEMQGSQHLIILYQYLSLILSY